VSAQDPGAATGKTPYLLGRCVCSCMESLHKPDANGVRTTCSNSNCTCRRYTKEAPDA
jgi:hypothetical protein